LTKLQSLPYDQWSEQLLTHFPVASDLLPLLASLHSGEDWDQYELDENWGALETRLFNIENSDRTDGIVPTTAPPTAPTTPPTAPTAPGGPGGVLTATITATPWPGTALFQTGAAAQTGTGPNGTADGTHSFSMKALTMATHQVSIGLLNNKSGPNRDFGRSICREGLSHRERHC
jgi:hypothetical protein